MNRLKKFFLYIVFLGGILNVISGYASKSVWTMEPAPGNQPTQPIPTNGIATIDYIVQNQSNKAHQLRILPISGISQTAPCNLAPRNQVGSNCILHLSIVGNLLGDEGVHGGPALCQLDSNGNPSPNTNQCYHPEKANELNLSKAPAASFFIGGRMTGLTANGLILQNNGVDNLSVAGGATTFEFSQTVANGSNYNVTIAKQPTGLICSVSNGFGTNVTAEVNSVVITCNIKAYTVGGTITGLTASGLVLKNNGEELPALNGATSFTFKTALVEGAGYNVSIVQQPNGMSCSLSGGSGTNVTQNITSVMVSCGPVIYTTYIANPVSSGKLNEISCCATPDNSALSNCQTFTDSSFSTITDVVINESASVAYVLSSGAVNDVSICPMDSFGLLSGPCTTTDIGVTVSFGGLNPVNNVLYLTNYNTKSIYVCRLNSNGTIILPCAQNFSNVNITSPNGRAAFTPGGKFIYIPNYSGVPDVAICPINPDGTIATSCTGFSDATFGASLGAALNAAGTYLYVANSNSTVTICAADPSTGVLSSCTASTGFGTFGFGGAVNNLFIDSNGFGYMPNDSKNTISICSIDVDGRFTACQVSVAPNGLNVSTLHSPRSVWTRQVL